MDDIKAEVQKHYAAIALQGDGCGCGGSDCCPSDAAVDSTLVDYGSLNMEVVEGANLGLGCGVPTLYAGLQPGQTVLDLGSGAGVDVFLAARAVGPAGRVIGVDMTPEMIARAWNNAVKGGYRNVEFRLGDIEALPVADASVDVVLSNCVINLAPDKRRVFAEIYRVMRPGGRFSISDMVTYGQVPPEIRSDAERWASCIAGAIDRENYLQIIREAGFEDVKIDKSVEYDALNGEGYGMASITVEGRKM
jgi:SAM-dependent methyltransferase